MDRRAFLSLGRRGRQRILELSCERLYVRWTDAEGRAARTGTEPEPTLEAGEPPTRVSAETCEDLLMELEERLASTDLLRVVEPEWLRGEGLARHVEASIAAFERRGGLVEREAPAAR